MRRLRAMLLAALLASGCGLKDYAFDAAEPGTDVAIPVDTRPDIAVDVDAPTDTLPPCDAVTCGGACVDLRTDAHHCGACDHDCTTLPHVAAGGPGVACAAGVCDVPASACQPGFAHCTARPDDGCETSLALATSCGGCGVRCGGATPACGAVGDAGGEYACVTGCSAATPMLCSGVCVDTQTDPTNCGLCGQRCPAVIDGSATCLGGSCSFECRAGFHRCGSVCADDTAIATCGSACTPCTAPANATATCTATGCDFVCASGFMRGTGGTTCVPSLLPPRPIAPISGSLVTTQRPTLRWQYNGTTAARLQICQDRGCAVVQADANFTGTATTLTAPLAAGVHYWRLFGRSGATNGTTPSPTWEFVVPAATRSLDLSYGVLPDFNGDGLADVIAGAPAVGSNSGVAYVYLGGRPLATTPTTTLTPPMGITGAHFGGAVAALPDVNGDGFVDALVTADQGASGNRAWVYFGSATGLVTTPAALLVGTAGTGFGRSGAGVGDINGDGYGDVLIGAPAASSNMGSVSLFLGSASGVSTTAVQTIAGTDAGGRFGAALSAAGDTNSDGFADVAVGAPGGPSLAGQVVVYQGSAAGVLAVPTRLSAGGTNAAFGMSVALAGDVDRNGYADLIVGAPGSSGPGEAFVFYGGPTGTSPVTFTALVAPSDVTSFGTSVARAGDVDGDGNDDVLVGAPTTATNTGRVVVYRGGTTGVVTTAAASLDGPGGTTLRFGSALGEVGDVDGDGVAEIAVGAPGTATRAGVVYLLHATTPAMATLGVLSMLAEPAGMSGSFGSSVALLVREASWRVGAAPRWSPPPMLAAPGAS